MCDDERSTKIRSTSYRKDKRIMCFAIEEGNSFAYLQIVFSDKLRILIFSS
jgi:hypothetical protein